MVGKDRVRTNIVAVDDTICYLLGQEMVLKLLDSNLSFTEFFLQSHITRYIDKTYREMQDKSMFYGGSDRLLFTTQVGDMAVKDVVSTQEDTTIREAAQIMSEQTHQFDRDQGRQQPAHGYGDRPGPPGKGRRTGAERRGAGEEHHEYLTHPRGRSGLLFRGRAENDQVQHPPYPGDQGRPTHGSDHEPRHDDAAGDVAALAHQGHREPADHRRAYSGLEEDQRHRRALAQGRGQGEQYHQGHHRDQ